MRCFEPTALPANTADRGSADTKSFSQLRPGQFRSAEDNKHVSISQFRAPMILTGWVAITAFVNHVLDVCWLVAQKKVSWVAARSIIATVQDIHTFRDRAKDGLPYHAMGQRGPLAVSHRAVTVLIPRCLPLPTFIWATAGDGCRQSFSEAGARPSPLRARLTAIDVIAPHVRLWPGKGFAAEIAGILVGHGRLPLSCHAGGVDAPPGFPIYKPNCTTQGVFQCA